MRKTKELICVYQDCPLCGDKGKVIKKIVTTKGINLRKVSFASEEGKDLIHEAVFEKGIKTMPFYTDGTKFSTDIQDFVEKSTKKVKRKGEDNGVDK